MKKISDFPIQKLDQTFIDTYFGHIPQKPKQLFIRGLFPTDKNLVFLTVVGAREITDYGRAVIEKLISGLRGYPIVIVSGLALGTDGLSHESAIANGLGVIAFPGSGLGESVIYPRSHYLLAEKILNHGGCLLSEYDEKTESANWTFPQRNRLMAAISPATLIIEATHKSGSRITTKLATEYGRDVLAVPGPITSNKSEGPNELIRLGAIPITCSSDILEALGFQVTETPVMDLFSTCTPDEAEILKLLNQPTSRNTIIRSGVLPTHKTTILLSQMELKGLIKEQNGMIIRI